MHTGGLEKLVGSATRAELLALLMARPHRSFHLREIAAQTGRPASSFQRELRRMEGLGLVTASRRANLKLFQANVSHPLYPELKRLVLKTSGLDDALREAVRRGGSVRAAFVFGSVAGDLEREGSDLDLMVIGAVSRERLGRALQRVRRRVGREINWSAFSRGEWRRRLEEGDPFVAQVMSEAKIMLIGSEDDLRSP